jgi:hypothetical protein
MSYLDDVQAQVMAWDRRRPRSQQTALGWSDMSSCRALMGFRLRGEWATDDVDTWPAIKGTVLHEWMAGIRQKALAPERNVSWEVRTEYRDVPGHVDEVDWDLGEVTDWKFTRLASLRVWDDPEVLDERFIQPQGYCLGVMANAPMGSLAHWKPPIVRLMVVPVDGVFADWRVYERSLDEDVVNQAVDRYELVREQVAEGEMDLPRDKPYHFCERWCEFFQACRGDQDRPMEEITDPEIAAAVEAYGLALEAEREADRTKKTVAPLLRGARGRARGFTVSMTRPGAGRMVPDQKEVEQTFEAHGWDVPYIPVPGKPASLRVQRSKKEE